MPQELVDLRNVRGGKQQMRYQRSMEHGDCMFCRDKIEQYHDGPIIVERSYWYVVDNDWPYKHTRNHFLIISQRHWTELIEIPPEAMAQLREIWEFLEAAFNIPGGALCFRFGDSKYNASSVVHLHAHIVVPDLSGPVKFTIGKDFSRKARIRRKIRTLWWNIWR